jgi:hypothetical protein
MSNFEERLLAALESERAAMNAAERPSQIAGRRPYVRALGLAGAAAGVAAVATVAVIVSGGTGTPAYAVTSGADGSVDTTINRLQDADGLEAALAEEGINADITFLPAGQTCVEPRGEQGEVDAGKLNVIIDKDNKISFDIKAGQIPADHTLVLVVIGQDSVPIANLQVIKGEVAPCEPVPGELVPGEPDSDPAESGMKEGAEDTA